eukprot:gene22536-28669_t
MAGRGRPQREETLACGAAIVTLSMGIRHGFGLWLQPITQEMGWTRQSFAFAIALQNLSWGVMGIFAGMAADRFGAFRVLMGGAVLYGLGLAGMALSPTPLLFALTTGLLIGAAQAGTTYAVIYGVLGRQIAPEKRSWAMGVAAAAGSFGQFLMVPVEGWLITGLGWQQALLVLSMAVLMIVPLAFGLREPGFQGAAAPKREQTIGHALKEAFSYPSFNLLMAGYFVCGFQVVFIGVHMPSYLKDHGLSPRRAHCPARTKRSASAHQRKRGVGHTVVEHIGGVAHGNAPGLGCIDRHFVQAHPKAGNHLDRGQCGQVLGRQANRCTGDHGIKLYPLLCQEDGRIGFVGQAVHAVAGVQGLFQRGHQFACLEDAVQEGAAQGLGAQVGRTAWRASRRHWPPSFCQTVSTLMVTLPGVPRSLVAPARVWRTTATLPETLMVWSDSVIETKSEDLSISAPMKLACVSTLPPGCGFGAYRESFEKVILPALDAYKPQLIIVACGYDAGRFDPLGRMMLDGVAFRWMTDAVLDMARKHAQGRVVMTHEGGYCPVSVPFWGMSVLEQMSGLKTEVVCPFTGQHDQMPAQKLQTEQARLVQSLAGYFEDIRQKHWA